MQFCIDKSIFWDNINLIFWKKSGKGIKKKMFLRQLCDCIELTLEMSNYKNITFTTPLMVAETIIT